MTSSATFKDEVAVPASKESAAGGPSTMMLVLAVIAAVTLSVGLIGGGLYWAATTGHLPLPGTSGANAESGKPAPGATAAIKTHPVVLEPILANLADQGGAAYLRVSITLRVVDGPPVKGEAAKPEKGKPVVEEEAAVRDTALDVIGKMTAVELLQTQGKEHLKQRLEQAIAQHVPELKVTTVYFTEFLVQQ